MRYVFSGKASSPTITYGHKPSPLSVGRGILSVSVSRACAIDELPNIPPSDTRPYAPISTYMNRQLASTKASRTILKKCLYL